MFASASLSSCYSFSANRSSPQMHMISSACTRQTLMTKTNRGAWICLPAHLPETTLISAWSRMFILLLSTPAFYLPCQFFNLEAGMKRTFIIMIIISINLHREVHVFISRSHLRHAPPRICSCVQTGTELENDTSFLRY